MAEEPPMTPPPRKPVSEFFTPVPTVLFYSEPINRDDPSYQENAVSDPTTGRLIGGIKRGTLYSSIKGAKQEVIDAYPNLYFVKESRLLQSDQWVIWTWATVPNAEDTYNAAIDYSSEAVAAPRFTRVYTIRRDAYEASPTIAIGSTLTAIIGVGISNPGSGYTFATGTVGTGGKVQFVISNGQIISGIVTDEGSGISGGDSITITGDGTGGAATARVQSGAAFLVSQKKQEFPDDHPLRNEFVQVVRVYETLPGPFIETTLIDYDGVIVHVNTRRNIAANITSAESLSGGVWTVTTKKEVDDFVGEESVTTRAIPGNPVHSSRLDDDGIEVSIVQTLKDQSAITTGETLSGGVWTKTTKERLRAYDVSDRPAIADLVANEVVETRAIPGNAMESERLDPDGMKVSVVKTMESAATIAAITTRETLSAGVWTKITSEAISDLVAWKVVETRDIPGNVLESDRLDDDGVVVSIQTQLQDTSSAVVGEQLTGGIWLKATKKEVSDLVCESILESRAIPGNFKTSTRLDPDGVAVIVNTRLNDTTAVTTSETIVSGVWARTTKKEVSDLICEEIIETRALPGNAISSASVNGEHEVENITTTLKDESAITPSSSESGGFITTVEKKDVTDLVANEIRTVTKWLDKADYSVSIPNVIPAAFMATLKTRTETHVVAGTAAAPTLLTGELERSEKQYTKLLKIVIFTVLDDLSVPVTLTNKETTSRFGGGDIDVIWTLDTSGSLTLDEGLNYLSSKIDQLGNGLEFKATEQLHSGNWTTLTDFLFDEEMQVLKEIDRQVVDPTYTLLSGADYVETIRGIDKWHSERQRLTRTPSATDSASAILSYEYHPFQFPGYIIGPFSSQLKRASSQLCKHIIRTWWQGTATVPSVDERFTDTCFLVNDVAGAGYERTENILHDDLNLPIGFFPATTPSASAYLGILGLYLAGTLAFTAGSASVVGTGTHFTTENSAGDTLGIYPWGAFQISSIADDTHLTLDASFGVTGSGPNFWNRSSGTPWIGNEKIISAEVKPTDIPNLWKVQTVSVVMR